MLKAAAFLLAFILCAGCSQAPAPAGKPAQAAPSDLPPAFRDCRVGFTSFTFPARTSPGTVPEGWNASKGVGNDVDLELLDCQKVSWGPFERGPVQLIAEFHDKGDVPKKCNEDRPEFLYNLERLLLSDAEMARYVHDAYGIVTDTASIRLDSNAVAGGPTVFQWTWNVTGDPASKLEMGQSTAAATPNAWGERWVWINGTGLGMLDVSESFTVAVDGQVGVGELHAPMLYAKAVPTGAYVGLANEMFDFKATSKHYRFGDQQCEQPLS